jgi:enamine deaminase RidA (YjgF/YER057c/UK114 family)
MLRRELVLLALLISCAPSRPPRSAPGPDAGLASPDPEAVSPPNVPQLPGFSNAVKTGRTVYLSGMVPLDSLGRLVGQGDLPRQAGQALANLAEVLRAARGVPADLVRLTVYLVGYDSSMVAVVRQAVAPYADTRVPPALTIVGVQQLPQPGMLIAVDGIAVLRGQFPDRGRDRTRWQERSGEVGRQR